MIFSRHPSRPVPADAGFVLRVASILVVLAISVDALLPALPGIAAELSPGAPNRAQLVVPVFVLGLGLGTLVAGPLADAWGRRPAILCGLALYAAGGVLGALAPSLEVLLAGRLLQGLGAALPKVGATALIRDRTGGRRMARLMSGLLVINLVVPAMAPALALPLLEQGGWRAVPLAMAAVAACAFAWIALFQPETLPPSRRHPLDARGLLAAGRHVLSDRLTRLYILALALAGAQIQALLSQIQPIYAHTYGLGPAFPALFLLTGLMASVGAFANTALVLRFGMRRLAIGAYSAQAAFVPPLLLGIGLTGQPIGYPLFFAWTISIFAAGGFTFGNVNALALEPFAERTGLATAIIGASATLLSVLIAAPLSQLFDGTPLPLMAGLFVTSCAGWAVLALARHLDPAARTDYVPEV